MNEKKRLFVAIKFSPNEAYISAYDFLVHRLRFDMISWIDPQSAHLTLKFFGNTPIEKTEKIINSISQAIKNQNSFSITIDKFGAFGSSHSPKVIWAGMNNCEEIVNLHEQLMRSIRSIGYFPDPGNFVPHITMGRVKKMKDKDWFWDTLKQLQGKEIATIKIDRIILYESILLKGGAKHIPLFEFPFNPNFAIKTAQ